MGTNNNNNASSSKKLQLKEAAAMTKSLKRGFNNFTFTDFKKAKKLPTGLLELDK